MNCIKCRKETERESNLCDQHIHEHQKEIILRQLFGAKEEDEFWWE